MSTFKKSIVTVVTSATLLTGAFVPTAGIIAPSIAQAAQVTSASSISAFTVPTIPQQGTVNFGTVLLTLPAGSLANSDSVVFNLPHGFTFGSDGAHAVIVSETSPSASVVVKQIQGSKVQGSVTILGSNNQVKIQLTDVNGAPVNNSSSSDDVKLSISLKNINANGPSTGPVSLTFTAPTTSAFPVGTVTVANVQTDGVVDLSVADTTSGNDNFKFNLTLKELVAGSLKTDSNSLKIKLPSGYAWTVPTGKASALTGASELFGDANVLDNITLTTSGDDTLYIRSGSATALASAVKLPLTFTVRDDSQTRGGDINAFVSGTTTTANSSIKVGTYGNYSSTVSVTSKTNIFAGQAQQKIGDIVIKESVPGTFISGRTVELTLPETARWEDVFEAILKNNGNNPAIGNLPTPALNMTTTNGLKVNASFNGVDYRTLKLTFTGNGSAGNTDPGVVTLKNLLVATSARATDLEIKVSGSAGTTGTLQVASVAPAGTMTVADVKSVVAGQSSQEIGDILIKEVARGAFNKDTVAGVSNSAQVVLELTNNIEWDKAPTVTVTKGDARVTNVYKSKNELVFTLDSGSSSEASEFKVSGGTIKMNQSTILGKADVKLKGSAVSYAATNVNTWANDTTEIHATNVVNVVAQSTTPTPEMPTGVTTVFKIGDLTYTVNGTTKTADVAPYAMNNRTYVALKYVAEGLGISGNDIVWNSKDQTVLVFGNNGRVVKMKLNSKTMVVNGITIAIDAAPVAKNGRTTLPIAHIARALGVDYKWDATAKTVTFNQK